MSAEAHAWAKAVPGLTMLQKSLLRALADYADRDHSCWPSVAALARDVAASERSIQRGLQELETGGHITRVARKSAGGRQTSNRIVLSVSDAGGVTQCHPKQRQPDTVMGDTVSPSGVTRVSPLLTIKGKRKGARDVQASPSARSPSPASVRAAQTSRPEAKPKAGADRRLVGDGLGGVSVPECPEAARRWANLRRAIWSKQVEALFRTWLPATAIRALRVAADGSGVLELGGFAARRVAGRPEIGAFLAEQGWRVEVSGAGG
jgi:hypothetical protein